jgi:hypothetical protein
MKEGLEESDWLVLQTVQPRLLRSSSRIPSRADAEIETDGNRSYAGLARLGYRHRVSLTKAASGDEDKMLPHAHRVASLLKRWLLGTHQGAVRATHLDYYLDEFTFRFNRRTSRSRGMLFFRLLQHAVQVGPAPYASLVGGAQHSHHNILGSLESSE